VKEMATWGELLLVKDRVYEDTQQGMMGPLGCWLQSVVLCYNPKCSTSLKQASFQGEFYFRFVTKKIYWCS
jgi:hypothetical protein